jgi:hypothetical protein
MTDEQLEVLFQNHRPAGPAPALKSRIVKDARSRSQWAFTETMAAVLLVGLNLSLIAASITQVFPTHVAPDPARTRQLAAAIQQLDLPLSQEDAQTMAQQLAAGENLVRIPLIHGPTDNSLTINLGGIP